jgi:hypothetical protein
MPINPRAQSTILLYRPKNEDDIGELSDTLTHEYLHAYLNDLRGRDVAYGAWYEEHGEDGLHFAL